MDKWAQYVDYQLPKQNSIVGHLLVGIKNKNPGLQAAMYVVCTDKGPGDMRNYFEYWVAHIVPYYLVYKNSIAGTNRGDT